MCHGLIYGLMHLQKHNLTLAYANKRLIKYEPRFVFYETYFYRNIFDDHNL